VRISIPLEVDVTDRLHLVGLRIDFDLTRFQRAGKGAGQSGQRTRPGHATIMAL
jgi:hypothetical protein